jgi:pimeloyl-ACP methyl ester carboxylesterase
MRYAGDSVSATDGQLGRKVRVGGVTLRVREHGDGPPLLLVNGIGAHIGMWQPLEGHLEDRRLIEFDAPGTGGSKATLFPLTMDALASLTAAVLDELGYERVDVLGYSFGGMVALRLALNEPERIRRLALVATTPGWGGVPGSLKTLAHMATPLRYYSARYYEATVGDLMGGRARHDRDFVRRHGRHRLSVPPDVRGYAWQWLGVAASRNVLPLLPTLRLPTLVVTGDDDPVIPPANAMLLAHHLAEARLLVLPGEGHLLLYDSQSAALPAIADFLGSPHLATSAAWRAGERVMAERLAKALEDEVLRWHHPLAVLNVLWRYISA